MLCDFFDNPPKMNFRFVAVAVGAGTGAASLYGSGSTKMMLLLAAPAPQHCLKEYVYGHYDLVLNFPPSA
jgi:hypothetical protein